MEQSIKKKGDREKPWQDTNGKPFSTEELKKISEEWRPHVWERYLQAREPLVEHDGEIYIRDISKLIQDASSAQTFAELYEAKGKAALNRFIMRGFNDKLKPSQKRVLKLKYWEGRTYREIAETMDRSPTSIQRTIDSSISILRQHIQDGISRIKKM